MKKTSLIILLSFLFSYGFSQAIKQVKIDELAQYIKNSNKPLIINFWATFCKPCVEEIPAMQNMANNYATDSVELILVSLDLPEYYPKKIENFATKKNFTAPIIWLNETNADVFCPQIDQRWNGAIPASLFVNNKTGYRNFYSKQLTNSQVREAIESMLQERRP